MELIAKDDPQYFCHTSDGLYDRHHYRVVSKTGASVDVESYDEVREIWWNQKHVLSHIEVIDCKSKGGGFV